MKETAQRIFRETLAAIRVPAAIERHLARRGSIIHLGESSTHPRSLGRTEIDLREFREIVAIAFGKAAYGMAQGLSAALAPDFPVDGILVAPAAPPNNLSGWNFFLGGHPLPSAGSFAAGGVILDRLRRCDDRSLIFFLLSGGGSSLVEQPLDSSISLDDFRQLHAALVTCGAPIQEINVIRKHLSATKGGRLAAAAPRSTKISLAISDVPEGEESSLASGPTLPDPSTVADAERIAAKFALAAKFPPAIRALFAVRRLRETPKPGDPIFSGASFDLVLGTHDLFHAAHRACEAAGYICLCDNSTDNWPVEKAAEQLLGDLELQKKMNLGKPVAVLADGELRSPVMGDGVGGRNSAFVLACVPKIAGRKVTVLSGGTDGIDGNSPAAGAVADGESLARAQAAGLDPADFGQRSDAYNFFERLGDAVITGPTGNNLRDLRIFLAD
ncbi:MAG: DUF4147 domain-containing protein [Candidatus Acidiferrales bacterium]